MKKTDLERLKAAHLKNQMKQAPMPERFGRGSGAVLDRRERRKLDQARPGSVVAELLKKGLAA